MQGAQNIGLSNHKVILAKVYRIYYDHDARPSQTDRRTDSRRTNIMAIARQFILTNGSNERTVR